MKPWQNGIPLELLQDVESCYDKKHNTYSLSPFTEMNKPAIAKAISDKKFHSEPGFYAVISTAKVNTPIKFFGHQIATKWKGSVSIDNIMYLDSIDLEYSLGAQLRKLD